MDVRKALVSRQTTVGVTLKLQVASDADRLDFLSKELTIRVVTIIIIDQHTEASGTAYTIEFKTGDEICIQRPIQFLERFEVGAHDRNDTEVRQEGAIY